MTWQEILEKYKNNKIMIEFMNYCDEYLFHIELEANMIQDVWGWLICFAETKGFLEVKSRMRRKRVTNGYYYDESKNKWYSKDFKTLEQAMLWAANRFFELANG